MRHVSAKLILILGVWLPLFYACSNDDDMPSPGTPATTLSTPGDTVANISELSTLAEALTAAELIAVLNQGEQVTIFAPNNTAFSELFTKEGVSDVATLVEKLSKGTLSDVLQAHVVPDSLPTDLLAAQEYTTLDENKKLTVTIDGSSVFANGAAVVTPDILIANGVIHIIDSVINLPPPSVAENVYTVVDTIAARDELSSLEASLAAVKLLESLRSAGPFTVFAPNNAAFDALIAAQQAGDLNGLVSELGDEVVADILQAHIVPDIALVAADILDKDVYNTISGATLTITSPVNTNEVRVNGALVLETDLVTETGVVHIIDSVVNLNASSDGSNGFTVTIENVSSSNQRYFQYGVFDTPEGATESGPAGSGQAYSFSFHAGSVLLSEEPTRLSFVSMLTGSTDHFLAFGENGIALYDGDGNPITGDISDQLQVYDAGTKTDAGEDEPGSNPVTLVGPATGVATATITNEGTLFAVTVTNTQTTGGLSPGVYGVHTVNTPIFKVSDGGSGAGLDGLKALAEDGNPSALKTKMENNEGFAVPLSPGVFAVHGSNVRPILTTGQADRGEGLEQLAEDGDPATLAAALATNTALASSGTFGTDPIGSGESYSFTVNAQPGDHLSMMTMMVQSNDIVYATPENGIPFFRPNGKPFNGNASRLMVAYDAGTETNEYPGAGLNQPIRQAALNTGAADMNNLVRRVTTNDTDPSDDGFVYRPVGERIRVIITPNP